MREGPGWLWAITSNGTPYCVSGLSQPECESDVMWHAMPVEVDGEQCAVTHIATTPNSSFVLDTQGIVRIYVRPALIAIRKRIEVCENQRWYPVLGWSRPLPTDRAVVSTPQGDPINLTHLTLPSTSWRWEEAWAVNSDRRCDKEGWEYAFSFTVSGPGKWKKEEGRGCFVRRRFMKRYMRYMAFARWIPLNDSELSFVHMAAGCRFITDGGCLLFAVATDGAIYRRSGISRESPEGDAWILLESEVSKEGNSGDFVFLSCAPILPTLLAGTWDGTLYYRDGIDTESPNGSRWCQLQSPHSQAVTGASVGQNMLWVSTVEGKVWAHYLELDRSKCRHDLSKVLSSSYVDIGTGMRQLSVTESDQVLCISRTEDTIFFRDGVCGEEPAGRTFVQLIERTGSKERQRWMEVSASGFTGPELPNHWKNSVYRIAESKSYKHSEWRQQILSSLCEIDERMWDVYNTKCEGGDGLLKSDPGDEKWTRKGQVRTRLEKMQGYTTGTIQLGEHELELTAGKIVLRKRLEELLLADCTRDSKPFRFCVYLIFIGSEYARLAFDSEEERDGWHSTLQSVILRCSAACPRDRKLHSAWSVGVTGTVKNHLMNELLVDKKGNTVAKPTELVRSVCVPGHFASISAGADRVVWAVTQNGVPYALAADWNVFDETVTADSLQTDSVEIEVYEYQRWALLRGFVTFPTEVEGVSAWMEGDVAVSGKYSRLPSRYWSWIDSEWALRGEGECWKYAITVNGPYTEKENKAKFRRRVWYRRAEYKRRAPWTKVDSPSLTEVVVQRQEAERILVWAVTRNGEVLVRQGITAARPQGTAWKQVLTDCPISCLSVESPFRVWAGSSSGRIMYRECASLTDMECVDWQLFDGRAFSQRISKMACSTKQIWIICGKTLVMINKGTGAVHSLRSVDEQSSVAVDLRDRLYLTTLDGQTCRMGEWVQHVVTTGKLKVVEYKCQSRQQLHTGIIKSISVV